MVRDSNSFGNTVAIISGYSVMQRSIWAPKALLTVL